MKELKQVYLELANGKISQKEAFDEIRKIKLEADKEAIIHSADLQLSQPLWDPIRDLSQNRITPNSQAKTLILSDNLSAFKWGQESLKKTDFLLVDNNSSAEQLKNKLDEGTFEQLLWIAPDFIQLTELVESNYRAYITQQEKGVLAVFKIIKSLLSKGYEHKKLEWTIITKRTQKVLPGDDVLPAHAGIFGLVGSLAKEYPEWKIRLLDIDSPKNLTLNDCLSLPWSKNGEGIALRRGEWFSQGLAQIDITSSYPPIYKQNGVYIVIGGAGGIGEVWSRYIVEKYQAKVVWIGRRAINETIQKKINSIAMKGSAPMYVSADATNFDSLEKAFVEIKKTHPKVNGVVHSAIILQDQSLSRMDELKFRASLAAKVDISVNLGEICNHLELDFLLFFSSVQSFTKAAGQSNYAAGCTFKDSFAQKLEARLSFPVRTMNWGYWGDVGIVSNASYKHRMTQIGIGSIETKEGMDALETLLSSNTTQMALIKTLKPEAIESISSPEQLSYFSNPLPDLLATIKKSFKNPATKEQVSNLKGGLSKMIIDELVGEIVASTLHSLGLFEKGVSKFSELASAKRSAPFYEKWLEHSIQFLRNEGKLKKDLTFYQTPKSLNSLWREWETCKSNWINDASLIAQVNLIESCLKNLPSILTGNQAATNVLFPNSSMQLVEGIYKGNALADYYNAVLGETLSSYIAQRISLDKHCKIRILEIGAGTGGTTAKLIPIIKKFGNTVVEYCYTDLSKAFLMHAEEQYQPNFPALTTKLFDISKPISNQAVSENHYDIVVATNVLHATLNIRDTLRNAKATLKKQGIVLLNEISTWSLFSHLTFGLLEGWWLYEDSALRITGSAGLTPEKWLEVLTDEGFDSTFFPANESHILGQQIIVSGSNGIVRQRITQSLPESTRPPIAESTKQALSEPITPDAVKNLDVKSNEVTLRHRSLKYFQKLIAQTLKMEPQQIGVNQPFEKYGLDSILVVQLTNKLRKIFPEITSTLFFEVQSVDGLTDYFLENKHEELTDILQSEEGSSGQSYVARETTNANLTSVGEPDNNFGSQSETQSRTQIGTQFKTKNQKLSQLLKLKQPWSGEGETKQNQLQSIFDVAVIGLSGRYPQSKNIDELWSNLSQGVNCISEIPKDRWDWQDYYHEEKGKSGKIYTKWGGFLTDIDKFDPLFFKISPKEAKRIDPQERLFLESCYQAIEDAGYTSSGLAEPHKVGVFAGVMNSRYTLQPNYFSIANRVSYLFNFQGPSMVVDTACSSSLTAIHLALDSLYSGLSDCAIAGGVNLIIDPVHYLLLSDMGMLSKGNQSKSFGENADGFIDAEGVGTIVLKPLVKAETDHDNIYGVIKASSINAGGKTNGYTVPNPKAQAMLVSQAFARAGVDANDLSYIEAHGTGTSLGDPIEISGLTRAFKDTNNRKQFCAIGSIKSNIGHCESAAGIAGLTKVLLQLKKQQLVPSLHSEVINSEINFSQTPFKLQSHLQAWPESTKEINNEVKTIPRLAGVSSFGAGGANAHIIVQEYQPITGSGVARQENENKGSTIVPISARTQKQLHEKCCELLSFLRSKENKVALNTYDNDDKNYSLSNLAFTLQLGREEMVERVGFDVESVSELIDKLVILKENFKKEYNAEQLREKNIFIGRVGFNETTDTTVESLTENRNIVDSYFANGNNSKLIQLWVSGLSIDWNLLYSDSKPYRISLPTYPFARERYWKDKSEVMLESSASPVKTSASQDKISDVVSQLHPLLHLNTSDLRYQCFSSKFSGKEIVIKQQHVVAESTFGQAVHNNDSEVRNILTPVAYLEMASAAVLQASPLQNKAMCLALFNTIWAQPLIVENETQINIALLPSEKQQIDFEIYSGSDDNEIIHCQGNATFSEPPLLNPVDLQKLRSKMPLKNQEHRTGDVELGDVAELYQGDNELLACLKLPESLPEDLDKKESQYQLHPHILEGVMQVATYLVKSRNGNLPLYITPFGIESVTVISGCTDSMFAWVRFADEGRIVTGPYDRQMTKVDVDLCDRFGNIVILIKGVLCHLAMSKSDSTAIDSKASDVGVTQKLDLRSNTEVSNSRVKLMPITQSDNGMANQPIKLDLTAKSLDVIGNSNSNSDSNSNKIELPKLELRKLELKKLDLSQPTIGSASLTPQKKGSVSLSQVLAYKEANSHKPIKLEIPSHQPQRLVELLESEDSILTIQIADANEHNRLNSDIVQQFLQALEKAQQNNDAKVLMIRGLEQQFLSGSREVGNEAAKQKLYHMIADFPYPTIALMQGDALGAGFLIGALCDYAICSDSARYSYTNAQQNIFPTAEEYSFFSHRFGESQAYEFLYLSVSSTGQQLKNNGWTNPIVSSAEVVPYGEKLAADLVKKSALSLRLLKQHLARELIILAKAIDTVDILPDVEVTTGKKWKAITNSKNLELKNPSLGVLVIRIRKLKQKYTIAQFINELSEIILNLNGALGINGSPSARSSSDGMPYQFKSIVLISELSGFLPEGYSKLSDQKLAQFKSILLSSALPIIAVLDSNAKGKAWYLSQFCDACFYSNTGNYSVTQEDLSINDWSKTLTVFSSSLGLSLAKEVVITEFEYTGAQLKQNQPAIKSLNSNDVYSSAVELAKYWSSFPLASLLAWRKVKADILSERIDSLPAWNEIMTSSSQSLIEVPKSIELKSDVVTAKIYPEGVVVIEMADRHAKNMFSEALVKGMDEVFNHIKRNNSYKVVILTGYDNYFSSGGTKETLLAIQEGRTKFTDKKVFQIALECELPVIAAMQGHGIGGGWALGMFADFLLMSEESHYVSPYMNYGFTPGAGSTFIFPNKIGYDLTRETLLTAKEYSGLELKNRGVSVVVLPRKQVLKSALELASQLTSQSRDCLIAFKQQWTRTSLEPLSKAYAFELEMHEKTFVGQTNTLTKIHNEFSGDSAENRHDVIRNSNAEISAPASNTFEQDNLIIADLKELLAHELQMNVLDVDENMQFVDLGLDSITGVTWVRKINEKYKTSLEATIVYSHPTISRLSLKVIEESNSIAGDIQASTKHQAYSQEDILSRAAVDTELQVESMSNITDENITESSFPIVNDLSEIIHELKVQLALELQMNQFDIGETTQFVDLGLDSITGVTWIRKINEEYGLQLEATVVYSHPTLAQLSGQVKKELERINTLNSSEFSKPLNDSKELSTRVQHVDDSSAKSLVGHTGLELSSITATLKTLLALELQMAEQDIGDDIQFVDIGLDSITGVTWIRKINDKFSTSIEATIVYSHPTLSKLSLQLRNKLSNTKSHSKELDINTANQPSVEIVNTLDNHISIGSKGVSYELGHKLTSWRTNLSQVRKLVKAESTSPCGPIAVIGMAGQFPKSQNLDEFWNNIAQGENCISQVERKRWDINTHYKKGNPTPGKTNSKWMGALENYDLFDPIFFTISPVEAESMDPQHRLFLQSCWHSIENAGYDAQSLSGTKCGVFVGVGESDYLLLSQAQKLSAQGFTGGASSILAGRISYFLNLKGPCLSIDTACSSSLVAIANACDSLNSFSSDTALAGGVSVMATPEMHIKTSQSGMQSTEGRCFTFDQRANGFALGEGVGVVMLKRLEDAKNDKDIIQGVIQGWGINQDGKTNGITAPNPESQTALQKAVYDKYDIDPASIQLIEAHGTGTKLGDPIEIEGLKDSFKAYTQEQGFCALGSVKSNIGHCGASAGIAGFIKILLALKHKKLPPTINFNQLNEHISLESSPFYISKQLKNWHTKGTEKRQAAISSFGFSGTNAHLVISEDDGFAQANEGVSFVTENSCLMVPISAKNSVQLLDKAKELLVFIQNSERNSDANNNENLAEVDAKIELKKLAYTLQVGREPMEERLGIMANSVTQLAEKLHFFIQGDEKVNGVFRDQVKKNKQGISLISKDNGMKETIIDKLIADKNLSKLLDLWVKGLDFNWNNLYGEFKPKRMVVPGYPFAKERYWLNSIDSFNRNTAPEQLSTVMHPLLHKRTVTLEQQGYSANFSGTQFLHSEEEPKLMRLPTYPFARQHCWIDPPPSKENKVVDKESQKKFDSIEDIIEQIETEAMETKDAVKMLNVLLQ